MKIYLEPLAPRTMLLLGVALGGGDPKKVAEQFMQQEQAEKKDEEPEDKCPTKNP